jgi:hypothetical protein
MNENLEQRYEALFEKLVPIHGKCETVEGEHLRAVSKIFYRWLNDGDYFYTGYGIETAGSAHAYLYYSSLVNVKDILKEAEGLMEGEYEAQLEKLLKAVVTFVEMREGKYTPNTVDMLNSKPLFEEDYDDDEDSN